MTGNGVVLIQKNDLTDLFSKREKGRRKSTNKKKNKRCHMGRLGVGIAAGFAVAACIVAAAMVGKRVKRRRKWKKMVKVLEELEESCGTPVGRLKQVVDAMAVEMHAGLASEGGSKLKMLLTYVDKLPNGYTYLP